MFKVLQQQSGSQEILVSKNAKHNLVPQGHQSCSLSKFERFYLQLRNRVFSNLQIWHLVTIIMDGMKVVDPQAFGFFINHT